MKLSYSRVSAFKQCPYKWKLRYLDEIEVLPSDDPTNALILGTAMHTGIEHDAATAVREYLMSYPIATDKHYLEALKLETLVPMVKKMLPPGQHEVKMENERFKGFVDLLVDNGNGTFSICDFKYSNNVDNYMTSQQLHVYKHFAAKILKIDVTDLYFVFIPKIQIRQKKSESEIEFLKRLKGELQSAKIQIKRVEFQPSKVMEWEREAREMLAATEFPKNETRLCDWCEYQGFCQKGDDTMLLPKNERRDLSLSKNRKIWIYGAAFTGKTTLANAFPDPLMLNTDGNIKFVDAPYIAIKNEVTVEGRITKTKLAWEVFKETIDELEKWNNDFKTIVVDLLEDLYEYCRLYMYDKRGWEHESDDSFRAWDMVRTEYLSTMKRLMNLDYDIVLISHEDTSKDLTKRGGDRITSVKPNINDKVANKVAGMVDVVARAVVIDGEHRLTFKTDEVVFGGGRLNLSTADIPMEYDELAGIYAAGLAPVKKPRKEKPTQNPAPEQASEIEMKHEPFAELKPEPEPHVETAPAKRTRKRRTIEN